MECREGGQELRPTGRAGLAGTVEFGERRQQGGHRVVAGTGGVHHVAPVISTMTFDLSS
ncbi:hypothetical protein ACFQX7_13505 [Luedemannella flava]